MQVMARAFEARIWTTAVAKLVLDTQWLCAQGDAG